MRKSLIIIICVVLLMCFGLVSPARATITIVDVNQEWLMGIYPGDSITCVSYFIPNIPNVPDSLIFTQPPVWTNTVPFDHVSEGWDTALADSNKTAYLFGPELTNPGSSFLNLFSYRLYYQWIEEEVVDFPVYIDVVVFNDDEVVYESSRWGTPGSPYEWSENLFDGPYENPIPEPVTICILGLGVAFLVKMRPAESGVEP